jgi:Ca-activated chloride channel homolog
MNKKSVIIIISSLVFFVTVVSIGYFIFDNSRIGETGGGTDEDYLVNRNGKTDDWEFDQAEMEKMNMRRKGVQSNSGFGARNSAPVMESADNMGFSVGGAKDINNFRENIKNNYLPLPSDITHEGLYYDYYFETGQAQECDKLFCPSYAYAVSDDPFNNYKEYYLSVGLNSNLKEEDFERKKLNLVVVLDISGSMGSPFSDYYYDKFSVDEEEKKEMDEDKNKNKMEIANEAVVDLNRKPKR